MYMCVKSTIHVYVC